MTKEELRYKGPAIEVPYLERKKIEAKKQRKVNNIHIAISCVGIVLFLFSLYIVMDVASIYIGDGTIIEQFKSRFTLDDFRESPLFTLGSILALFFVFGVIVYQFTKNIIGYILDIIESLAFPKPKPVKYVDTRTPIEKLWVARTPKELADIYEWTESLPKKSADIELVPERREYSGLKQVLGYRTGMMNAMPSDKAAHLMATTAILDVMASGAYGDNDAIKNTLGYLDGKANAMPSDKFIEFLQTGKQSKY